MREALRSLMTEGLESISRSSFGMERFQGAIAYYDSRKDKLLTDLPAFANAVRALKASPEVQKLFGANEAGRIALQFVFNAYPLVRAGASAKAAFDVVWEGFSRELGTPTWTFAAVANLQNFEFAEHAIGFADGISIRSRSFSELEELLGWTQGHAERLAQDWSEGFAASSFVLVHQRQIPKSPENFLLTSDGSAYVQVARALLALRLVAPGDIRVGRLFVSRPMRFNVGIGGIQSSGASINGPGRHYVLTEEIVTIARKWYKEIEVLDQKIDKPLRNLALAFRSFSSMYERHFHQAEDRIIDAITALEALWKLDAELAFRLSYRTASLLGATDDERVEIYETVSQYYKVRSKIIHGSPLSESQSRLVQDNEALRDIVRRTLRGFLHLANHPGHWTLERLYEDADVALLHDASRKALRSAMALPIEPMPKIADVTQGSVAALAPRP